MNIVRAVTLFLLFSTPLHADTDDPLAALSYMEGSWTMVVTFYENGSWGEPKQAVEAAAERVMDGAFLRMRTPVEFPGAVFQFEMTLAYDRFNKIFRLLFLDDLNGYLDLYTGQLEDGVLSTSNAGTGTAFPNGEGGFVIGQVNVEQTDDGFRIQAFVSSSADGPFEPYMNLNFTP